MCIFSKKFSETIIYHWLEIIVIIAQIILYNNSNLSLLSNRLIRSLSAFLRFRGGRKRGRDA
jgi:hypothetical protein